MRITQQLHDSKGRKMNMYLCTDEVNEFLFKEILNDTAIEYEMLVQELAKKIGVKTLPFLQKIDLDNKKGLLMSFLQDSLLLCHSTAELNTNQKKELQKIILMDLLVGNKDRHAANLFINTHITAFDHDRLFIGKERKSSAFVKLEIGKKMDKQYIPKLEQIIHKGNISTATALLDYFEFDQKDIINIKSLSDQDFYFVVNSLQLDENRKMSILEFLKYRRDNFDSLRYA